MICFNNQKFKTINDKLYFGTTKIGKAYYGSTLVYPETTPSPTPTPISASISNAQADGYHISDSANTWRLTMQGIDESALTSIEVKFVIPALQDNIELYKINLVTQVIQKKTNGQWNELPSGNTELFLSKTILQNDTYYQMVIPNADSDLRVVYVSHTFNPNNTDIYTFTNTNFYVV